eukprot:symbB.v1.2.010147.t1/scaffold660.1/size175713/4
MATFKEKSEAKAQCNNYEDYQRDIERYQQRKNGKNGKNGEVEGYSVRSNSLPPDFLGEESGISGIRPSQLTHLGGFRREYLHRKRDSAVPVSEDPNTRSEVETNSQTTLMLAAEIEDQMSYMAFLADMDDDSPGRQMRLLADALPELRPQKKKMSVAKACVSTFKAFIATGILFVPQAMTNAGWGWAILLMTFSCIISTIGILLLAQCHQHHSVSYPLLGRKAFGGYGYFLIAGQVAFSQFCFCSSYYIFISTTIQNLYANHHLVAPSTLAIMLVVCCCLTPLGWIRRIGKMKVVNLIGNTIIIISILSVAATAVVKLWRDGVSKDVVIFAPPSRVLIFAGTSVYAFEGIALVIPIREGMEKPEYFPHMLVGMMLFFVVFLTGFGILGYFAWGNDVKPVALNELPGNIGVAIQLFYILAIFCGYPLAIFPTFAVLESRLFSSGPPTLARKWSKNLFRTSLTLLMGAFAYQMSEYLSLFISMLGSFCSIPLAIIFPAMLHLKLISDNPKLDWTLIAIGSVLVPMTLFVDINMM